MSSRELTSVDRLFQEIYLGLLQVCSGEYGYLVKQRQPGSSAESKGAIAQGACYLWRKMVLEEFGVVTKLPLKLYCDDKAAVSVSYNPVHHDQEK